MPPAARSLVARLGLGVGWRRWCWSQSGGWLGGGRGWLWAGRGGELSEGARATSWLTLGLSPRSRTPGSCKPIKEKKMHVIRLNDIGRKKGANQTKDVLSSLLVLYCCHLSRCKVVDKTDPVCETRLHSIPLSSSLRQPVHDVILMWLLGGSF